MTQQAIVGTAFEYAEINILSARISNDLSKLISLMQSYKRPPDEIKQMAQLDSLMKEYHFTYTSSGLNKFLSLQ